MMVKKMNMKKMVVAAGIIAGTLVSPVYGAQDNEICSITQVKIIEDNLTSYLTCSEEGNLDMIVLQDASYVERRENANMLARPSAVGIRDGESIYFYEDRGLEKWIYVNIALDLETNELSRYEVPMEGKLVDDILKKYEGGVAPSVFSLLQGDAGEYYLGLGFNPGQDGVMKNGYVLLLENLKEDSMGDLYADSAGMVQKFSLDAEGTTYKALQFSDDGSSEVYYLPLESTTFPFLVPDNYNGGN